MNASDTSDEMEQASEAVTNAAGNSQGIRWYKPPRTWQTCCFDPLSQQLRLAAPSKPLATSPARAERSTRGGAAWQEELHSAPWEQKTPWIWGEKGERKPEVTPHVSNANWETFEFLLPAASEAKNKT